MRFGHQPRSSLTRSLAGAQSQRISGFRFQETRSSFAVIKPVRQLSRTPFVPHLRRPAETLQTPNVVPCNVLGHLSGTQLPVKAGISGERMTTMRSQLLQLSGSRSFRGFGGRWIMAAKGGLGFAPGRTRLKENVRHVSMRRIYAIGAVVKLGTLPVLENVSTVPDVCLFKS